MRRRHTRISEKETNHKSRLHRIEEKETKRNPYKDLFPSTPLLLVGGGEQEK